LNRRDFAKITAWVFDLDNTLYPPDYNIAALIDVRITQFIMSHLKLSREAAFDLQKTYWRKYGLTLIGLMKKHDIKARAYLEFVHDIDIDHIKPNPALQSALSQLAGAKYIFTDSTREYGEKITHQLGIAQHFDGIFDICDANYMPKPNKQTYEKMLAQFRLVPQQVAFFEDIARNLAPAHALGMTTIWLRWPRPANPNQARPYYDMQAHSASAPAPPPYIDYIIEDLVAFLDKLADNG